MTDPVVAADEQPPPSIAWYQSPQVLAAVAAIGGGILAFCTAFHIVIPYTMAELTMGIGGALSVVGGGFALYRRIKAGLDPTNDASKIKLIKGDK